MTNIVRKISMADPHFTVEDRDRIHHSIDEILSGALSMGPNVKEFESEFASLVNVRHGIAMNSCTSALEAALIGFGVKPGDEVIMPCETFIATGMAVQLVGGVPVFAEISERDFCLDLNDVKKRITPRTRGIILVYMAGVIPENIIEFRNFCDDNHLFFLEDAAHAPGACRDGKVAGSFGHAGCFSFYPTKVITSGEGGMLTTDDDRLAEFARSFQHRGRDMSASSEQFCRPGRNVRMPEMSALLGRVQLSHLMDYLVERRRVAAIYRNGFTEDNRLRLILPDVDTASSYWKVPLLLSDNYNREEVSKKMKEKGISVDFSYQPALHLQPVFKSLYNIEDGHLPKSERLLSQHICLPCHPRISNEDAKFVVDTLKNVLDSFGLRCDC